MKNDYRIDGDTTILIVEPANSDFLEVLIDTDMLSKVKSFPNAWCAVKKKVGKWEIRGTITENKKKRQVYLRKFLFDKGNTVINASGNDLDYRSSNMIADRNTQVIRGNKYTINGDGVRIELKRRLASPLYAEIDIEDLERVINKGTWFTEEHPDFNTPAVMCVSYVNGATKRKRVKQSLHSFILGLGPKDIINHKDGNRLNNRKENLRAYSNTMLNRTENMEDGSTRIYFGNNTAHGGEFTLIDTEDLERVSSMGYTWQWFRVDEDSYPYALNNGLGHKYLHRIIVSCPDGYEVDHINHNTLDNRKVNLKISTKSQNMQNRKGSRKNSRSGIRGVSWDNNNKDWIVNVGGVYYARTKNLEEAEKMAKEKIKETMPYLSEIEKI